MWKHQPFLGFNDHLSKIGVEDSWKVRSFNQNYVDFFFPVDILWWPGLEWECSVAWEQRWVWNPNLWAPVGRRLAFLLQRRAEPRTGQMRWECHASMFYTKAGCSSVPISGSSALMELWNPRSPVLKGSPCSQRQKPSAAEGSSLLIKRKWQKVFSCLPCADLQEGR